MRIQDAFGRLRRRDPVRVLDSGAFPQRAPIVGVEGQLDAAANPKIDGASGFAAEFLDIARIELQAFNAQRCPNRSAGELASGSKHAGSGGAGFAAALSMVDEVDRDPALGETPRDG